ncbi:M23 family metallopeptidase [Luteolibacter sp. SL250]|uniref:murein hydrolase activator EnvC family protein n=1 Tax=Luteolibacter sp. SL250 TaxID=2995170 RepID=UPI00227011CF|nr:M23 family metallopeptidase [Luteolibacter sp. SL250]WAC20204.1 M23 family metallopeptidase [Luteolibacter sp. SL250]
MSTFIMENTTPSSPSAVPALIVTTVVALGITGAAIWQAGGGGTGQIPRFGKQSADSPLVMPEKGAPDLAFRPLSPWQTLTVPTAVRLDPPAGTENGAFTHNAQPFWAKNEKRGANHTGDDLHGIGGNNTNLGDPVFAIGDGLVVFAGASTAGWGNVVIIAHKDAEGKPLQSVYGHLDKVEVKTDALVARGTKLGTIGTADGQYPAHLHLELRAGDVVDAGSGYAKKQGDLLNPAETIGKRRKALNEAISASPLAKALVP